MNVISTAEIVQNDTSPQAVGVSFKEGSSLLGGGSYASSNVVQRFRKTAKGRGKRKLCEEIHFLQALPHHLRPLYPQLIAWGITDDAAFIEQEFIPARSARRQLFDGVIDAQGMCARLEAILECLQVHAYRIATYEPPADYLDQFYFNRVWRRINHTVNRVPMFGKIVNATEVIFNGHTYWNIPIVLRAMERNLRLRKLLQPQRVSPYAHGDLHLENILVDPSTSEFHLVDPRGYPFCDIHYDLGKLSHCTNGKYDLLHEQLFVSNWSSDGDQIHVQIEFTDQALFKVYGEMDQHLRSLYRDIGDGDTAMIKTLFAEAMHFGSDMPFHLAEDGVEKTSLAIYFVGVKLINECAEALGLTFNGKQIAEEVKQNFERLTARYWVNEA